MYYNGKKAEATANASRPPPLLLITKAMLLSWFALAPRPVPLALLRHAQPLLCDEAAAPSPLTPAYADTAFDRALGGILADAATMGLEPALDSWLEQLDDLFIPTLASRVDASTASAAAELPQLSALLEALELRTSGRFERAREQLQALLAAGEINDMNAQLIRLVRKDEIDAGFVYVLLRNIEDAEKNGEEPMVRLLSHLHTVTQEELEKRTAPALGLLHKLTRLDDAGIRGRVLRDNLSPKTSLEMPDGSEMPLAKPTAARPARAPSWRCHSAPSPCPPGAGSSGSGCATHSGACRRAAQGSVGVCGAAVRPSRSPAEVADAAAPPQPAA